MLERDALTDAPALALEGVQGPYRGRATYTIHRATTHGPLCDPGIEQFAASTAWRNVNCRRCIERGRAERERALAILNAFGRQP